MTDIFIVQIDEYDDQCIIGAFSTMDKAKKVADEQLHRAKVFVFDIDVELDDSNRDTGNNIVHVNY